MKRSEFRVLRSEFWKQTGGGLLDTTIETLVERDCSAAEVAGVKWDPEEPELPKRLNFIDRLELPPCASLETTPGWIVVEAVGRPDHSRHPGTAFTGPLLAAMVDAYNRLQSGELVDKMEAQSVDHFVAHSLSALIAKIGAAVGASGTADQITGRVIAKLAAFRGELDRMKVWQGVAEELREKLDDRTNRADRAVAILEGA